MLVAAAEKRLLDSGCKRVQIEYEYTVGDPYSERLLSWYEGKLGFSGGPKPRQGSCFRAVSKKLSADQVRTSISEPDITAGRVRSVSQIEQTAGETCETTTKKATCGCAIT